LINDKTNDASDKPIIFPRARHAATNVISIVENIMESATWHISAKSANATENNAPIDSIIQQRIGENLTHYLGTATIKRRQE
jgi:hypothetical protein